MPDEAGQQARKAAAVSQRESHQLRRLETLIDVVFALVIVMITVDLPVPEETDVVRDFIVDRLGELFVSGLGIAVLLIYWFQSNLLLGNLRSTDMRHAAISVFQVFLVLIYLLTVGYSISVGSTVVAMVAQSAAATLMGLAAAAGWWYASWNRRLLSDEIDEDEAAALSLRVLAEPATALITIIVAFLGPWLWELSWFVYPLVAGALNRLGVEDTARARSRRAQQKD